MENNLKIVFIEPCRKAAFSHRNIYQGLSTAFKRNSKVEVFCLTVEEALNTSIKPDYFFSLDHPCLYHKYYDRIRKKAKLAVWLLEDPYEIDLNKNICRNVDVAFSMDQSGVSVRRRNGYRNIFLLPLGTNRDVFNVKIKQNHYFSDIFLVGVAFPNRIRIAKEIARYCFSKKLKFKVIGLWWDRTKDPILCQYTDNRIIDEKELSNFYNNARIVLELNRELNTHNSSRIQPLTPGRGFNSCACGAFTISSYRETIENYYISGKEIEIFTEIEDLKEKLDKYIYDDILREKIALEGFNKTINYHTLDHRVEKLIRILKELL